VPCVRGIDFASDSIIFLLDFEKFSAFFLSIECYMLTRQNSHKQKKKQQQKQIFSYFVSDNIFLRHAPNRRYINTQVVQLEYLEGICKLQ
jgi:hypothetical protein